MKAGAEKLTPEEFIVVDTGVVVSAFAFGVVPQCAPRSGTAFGQSLFQSPIGYGSRRARRYTVREIRCSGP